MHENLTQSCYFNQCNRCKDGALFKEKCPSEEILDEMEQSGSVTEQKGEETSEPSCVNWYQWEDTTNSLGYNNLAKVLHERHLLQFLMMIMMILSKLYNHSFGIPLLKECKPNHMRTTRSSWKITHLLQSCSLTSLKTWPVRGKML